MLPAWFNLIGISCARLLLKTCQLSLKLKEGANASKTNWRYDNKNGVTGRDAAGLQKQNYVHLLSLLPLTAHKLAPLVIIKNVTSKAINKTLQRCILQLRGTVAGMVSGIESRQAAQHLCISCLPELLMHCAPGHHHLFCVFSRLSCSLTCQEGVCRAGALSKQPLMVLARLTLSTDAEACSAGTNTCRPRICVESCFLMLSQNRQSVAATGSDQHMPTCPANRATINF